MNQFLTKQHPANKRNEMRVARAAFQALHIFKTDVPQDIHSFILTVCCAMERIHPRTAKKYAELVACSIKIGHFAGMNGRPEFKAQPAEWFSKRWRCISKKAVRTGILFANPAAALAASVPKQ
jgi:hypothetical protein